MTERVVWSFSVGTLPHVVTVYERAAKGMVLYLRWRAKLPAGGTNWKHTSLKKLLRDARGRVQVDVRRWAEDQAQVKHRGLVAAVPEAERPRLPFMLIDGRRAILRPDTGLYPTDSGHRREVLRALDYAIGVWGEDRRWDSLAKADLRALWRRRIRELSLAGRPGLRGAEITTGRLLAVAAWLRDEDHIPPHACLAPRNWKQDLRDDWRSLTEARSDYEPSRPRHSLEEMRKVLATASTIDPRFGLLMALGAELRLGQVSRARRSDVDLEAGRLRVMGRGGKRGVTQILTPGQRAALAESLAGYLQELEQSFLEHQLDYPLFPSGQLTGGRKGAPHATARHRDAKPITRTTWRHWFAECEQAAGIEHVSGRGPYGLRRRGVDSGKDHGISREGLKDLGGWVDTQIPDMVYAEQAREQSMEEAADVRAKIRGEK